MTHVRGHLPTTDQTALLFLTTTTKPRHRADFKPAVLGEPEFSMLRIGQHAGRSRAVDVATETVEPPSLPSPGPVPVHLSGGLNAPHDVWGAASHFGRLGRIVNPHR